MRAANGSIRKVVNMACALAMATSLAGCTSSEHYAANTSAQSEEYVGSTAVYDAEETADGATGDQKQADDAVIIKNATVVLRTRSFDAALDAVRQCLAAANGTQVSSSESGGYDRSITLSYRVDPDKIEDAVEQLRAIEGCTVLSANLSSSDVTRTFNSTERKLEILEEEYEHYKKMLEEATTTEDMLLISDRMYDVMSEIKVLTDERDDMAHNAARSLIEVTIEEELASGQTGESHGNIYAEAWEDSWGFFGQALQALALIAIFLIPFALIVLAIVAIVVAVRRRMKRRRADKAEGTVEDEARSNEVGNDEAKGDEPTAESSDDAGDGRPPKPPLA